MAESEEELKSLLMKVESEKAELKLNIPKTKIMTFSPISSDQFIQFRYSAVSLLYFATLWTVACQAHLSMGFSRQEHWSGLPCLPTIYKIDN